MIARGYSADLYCDGGDRHHQAFTKLSLGGVESWRACKRQAQALGWTILPNLGEGEKAYCPNCTAAAEFAVDQFIRAERKRKEGKP